MSWLLSVDGPNGLSLGFGEGHSSLRHEFKDVVTRLECSCIVYIDSKEDTINTLPGLHFTMRPLIRIHFEKPAGPYYAGDVVRGTVTIKAPGQKSKGAFLTLETVSSVRWTEGARDTSHECKGKTIYQAQCETLYANHARTATLEVTGTKACFDQVKNSGIMRIPCDFAEEHHFPLVVRVNGRDQGTREIILGEVLVDIPKLVSTGTKQIFELVKNGRNKNTNGSMTLSAEFRPFDEVYPTKSREGVRLSSILTKPLCLILRVHEAAELPLPSFKSNVCVRAYRLREATAPGKMIHLPDDEVTAPFAFQLRGDAPGSAKFPALFGIDCSVRYTFASTDLYHQLGRPLHTILFARDSQDPSSQNSALGPGSDRNLGSTYP